MERALQVHGGVGKGLTQRDLAAGQNHRDMDAAQHIREDSGSISHGIRAVSHNDTVIAATLAGDEFSQLKPLLWLDVGGVQCKELLER